MLTLKDLYLIKSLHTSPTVKTSKYVLRMDVSANFYDGAILYLFIYLFIYCSEMNEGRNASRVKI